MNYLRRNNRQGKGAGVKNFLIALAITVAAVMLYVALPGFIGEKLFAIARPMWSARDYVAGLFQNVRTAIESKELLAEDNASLTDELSRAQASLLTLDDLKKENETLKSMLGRTGAGKSVVAAVLAKPNRSLYDTLVLDAGLSGGVTVGSKVVSGDFIIGEIRNVENSFSKAVLYSSPGETTPVSVGQNAIQTEATGMGGGNFVVKLPKEVSVVRGDLVSLPGVHPKYFGAVESVEQTVTDPFQFVLFHLPVNIATLKWVDIIQ